MIEAEKLTKRYRPVTAVDGLTFTARPGHVTGFLGPNGARGAVAIGVIAAAGRRPRRLSPGR
jgi:ABC-2 type transport system ATP-binding protein